MAKGKGNRPRSGGRRIPRATARRPARRSWRKRIGWPMVAVGAVLFLMGNIGARTGIVLLPFDPHHVLEQFGGALVLIMGIAWVGGKR